jgi:hypothetical protein
MLEKILLASKSILILSIAGTISALGYLVFTNPEYNFVLSDKIKTLAEVNKLQLTGKWRGTITEKGKPISMELQLVEKNTGIEGSLTILTKTGQAVEKGMVLTVVEARRSGNALKFIVPISEGKVDDDAFAFDLVVEGKNLKGYGHELREGSDKLLVTFAWQG